MKLTPAEIAARQAKAEEEARANYPEIAKAKDEGRIAFYSAGAVRKR